MVQLFVIALLCYAGSVISLVFVIIGLRLRINDMEKRLARLETDEEAR